MPESRGRRRTTERREIPNLRPKTKPKKEWPQFRKLLAVVLGLATLIGVPAAIVAFWPRVSIDLLEPTDGSDPFSAPFTVTNTGIMPLRQASFFVGLCKVSVTVVGPSGRPQTINVVGTPDQPIGAATPPCITPNGARLTSPAWANHRLAPDEKYAGSLADMHFLDVPMRGGQINEADITMIATFQPWIIPRIVKTEFRFVAVKQPNGTFRWFARTLDNR
jgi:hypothetical protein